MFRGLFRTDSWPERNGFLRQIPEWLWPSVGGIGFDLGHLRPHENPNSVQSEASDCVRTKSATPRVIAPISQKVPARQTLPSAFGSAGFGSAGASIRLGGSLALPAHTCSMPPTLHRLGRSLALPNSSVPRIRFARCRHLQISASIRGLPSLFVSIRSLSAIAFLVPPYIDAAKRRRIHSWFYRLYSRRFAVSI
jgi:hypothetical protein